MFGQAASTTPAFGALGATNQQPTLFGGAQTLNNEKSKMNVGGAGGFFGGGNPTT